MAGSSSTPQRSIDAGDCLLHSLARSGWRLAKSRKGAAMSASMRVLVLCAALACGPIAAVRAAESPPIHPAIQAAVDSQERLPKDRARDENRHYAEIMEFF